jgi:hypothetical protein
MARLVEVSLSAGREEPGRPFACRTELASIRHG